MSGGLSPRRKDSYRTLAFECLDSRQLLSASPSDPQVATPDLIVATAGDAPTVGYSPSQILGAYGFNQLSFGNTPANGAGQTIAIVDAYNDPFLKSDLYKFDTKYGIPAPPSL